MKKKYRNKYGYKVCYLKEHTKIPVRRFVTYTYRAAKQIKKLYYQYPPPDDNNVPISHVRWGIYPITRKEVLDGIWRECPF